MADDPLTAAGGAIAEPGSFRDFDSRVFRHDGRVFRALSPAALEDFEAVEASAFFERTTTSGALVGSRRAEDVQPPAGAVPAEGCAAVLEHEAIPFLSWPYEWPHEMLRDAALGQLEIMAEALASGLILKDATPYNTQWRGTRPVFIDVGSIERWREGEPWFGYRQFCMQFLYPLMLQAFRGVPFQPWLRGRMEGIAPDEMRRLLTGRDRLRRGVLTHVVLHARLERRHAADTSAQARRELKRSGFRKELIEANVRGLAKLVRRLEWKASSSTWSSYRETSTYSDGELTAKEAFVDAAARSAGATLAWDLGCNDGRFSRIAARHASYVVAIDADQLSVDRLYAELRAEGEERILPLTMDFVDASPGLGWRGAERAGLAGRGRPGLVLALALVHHMSIGAGVPVEEVVDWLAGLGDRLVLEVPHRDDPMVERLLAQKRGDAHPDFHLERFEDALRRRMTVERTETHGTRTLFDAVAR